MTTLAAPAQPTDTVLTVVDGSSFPTVPFAVLIDTEVIFVTAIDSTNPNNWGVQRNRQNSTASPHAVGALVQLYSVYDVNVQGKITPTVNFAVQTTLAAAAQQTTTNLTVADGSSFPVVPFAVLIDSEIILVTALDPTKTNWTVQRGMWGTTAVAHQSNAQVLLYLGLPIPAPQGVTATATQLPVSNGSAFPAARFGTPASWFVVIVDAGNPVLEEIILVMDTTDPNNWTVQRGWLGTTPVAHSQYAQVQLYAGQMLRITSLVADQGFSITVSSGLNFPATVPGFPIAVPGDATQPPFLIRIENEVLLVTDGGRSKTQWTVVRAQEGTTATGHSASAQVLLHQRLGIGQIVDALSPSLVDGSAITTSSPRSSVPGNAAIGLPSFVPIFDNTSNLAMSNGALVVGFGQIQWNAYTGPGSLGNSVLIEKQSGAIASQNVTTVFTPPQILTAAQLTQVLATNKTLIEAVQAPALVRSIKP